MKYLPYTLFLLFLAGCGSLNHNYDNPKENFGDTRGRASLPSNPDPSKCYVRTVTPDVYASEDLVVFTYHEDDAFLYPHKKRRVEVKPEVSRWETTTYEGCESDNPNDCQVLCWRTYPAKYVTYYEPLDSTVGDPYLDTIRYDILESKGGLAAYEEIDCDLTNFNTLPVYFTPSSAALQSSGQRIVDDRLLPLLRNRPNLRIEINAHTSSRGTAADNQDLSERRAKAVADYLVGQGIYRSRLVTRGYGEGRLVNRCADGVNCSEEEHAANVRMEFRVLTAEM